MAQGAVSTAGQIKVDDRHLRWQVGAWTVVADGARQIAEDVGRILFGAPGGESARDGSEPVLGPAPPQAFEFFAGVAAESGRTARRVADLARQAERASHRFAVALQGAATAYQEDQRFAADTISAAPRAGGHP